MKSLFRATVLAAVCATIPATAVTTLADAAPLAPFTITEAVVYGAPVDTFTATGPLCGRGIFSDSIKVDAYDHSPKKFNGRENLLIETVYTCADGSGTFSVQKHVHITFDLAAQTLTNVGPVRFTGGTGAYAGIIGHGVDLGAGSFAVGRGTGHISGVILQR